MIEALLRFINQRSGIDFQNYSSGDYKSSCDAFNGDYRPMLKHGRHARAMLRQVELCARITASNLLDASRAYSSRLQFREDNGKVSIEYTTGQYFPTEYRKAACAVLAQCLWDYWSPDCKTSDEIRKTASRNLGRNIAKTWFN